VARRAPQTKIPNTIPLLPAPACLDSELERIAGKLCRADCLRLAAVYRRWLHQLELKAAMMNGHSTAPVSGTRSLAHAFDLAFKNIYADLSSAERLEMAATLIRYVKRLVGSVVDHNNSPTHSVPLVIAAQCLDLPGGRPGLN